MYQTSIIQDEIAVPPIKFNLDLNKAISESIEDKHEGKIDTNIGVILAITGIDKIGEGRVLPGNPDIHYDVTFKTLTWMPYEHEIVEGHVIDITEFGCFVRIGGLDGLVHVSQVMDDFVSYDEKNAQLVGRSSRQILKEGDGVRARIISVSFKEQSKVGLTMRQPYLGAIRWLDAKEKEAKKAAANKVKETKPAKGKKK
jgi:DNA-directed RNA polymerase subunit E'